jgi:hypothetical protein
MKIQLKGRHFDTIEVIDAELRAVLYTLTEHDFTSKWQNRWERCICVKGDYFEGDGGR